MSFTSSLFFPFIALFFALWVRYPHRRYALVFSASLLFYGAWRPIYVLLLLCSSYIAFFCAHRIQDAQNDLDPIRGENNARFWVKVGVGGVLLILCYFKYANFAIRAWSDFGQLWGGSITQAHLDILLPVGISFYSFQSISHTVDVYRKQLRPPRSYWHYVLFEAYFPHLVAGPIQKASFLIPQVEQFAAGKLPNPKHKVVEGLELIIRGYLKKLLVADTLAPYVNQVFEHLPTYRLATIGLATLCFTIQIYCDFSGYTDIARGLAKTMGFEFTLNFDYPYLSRSASEFWKRWHISLSSWLREYLYIPLGGNRGGTLFVYRNLMATMLLGGLWHGANYTFLAWGFYQGGLLVGHRAWEAQTSRINKTSKSYQFTAWMLTTGAVILGWYIFRMNRIEDLQVLNEKLWNPAVGQAALPSVAQKVSALGFLAIHFAEGALLKRRLKVFNLPPLLRAFLIIGIVILLILFSPASSQEFIYFQF